MASCTSAINSKTSDITAKTGYVAQQQGDWDAARRNYAKALLNAELGSAAPQKIAALNYEYGRSLGVTCFFEEAETYLLKALKLDAETDGPTHMSILELARLNYDRNRFSEASQYFRKLLPLYDKYNAELQDPIGVADVYQEYAMTLNKTGETADAALFQQRATALKSSAIGKLSSAVMGWPAA